MGTLGAEVQAVNLDDVETIPLPNDSWSRIVLNKWTIRGIGASLGYSVFKPGTVLSSVSHETEELAYVVAGTGELRLEDGDIAVEPNDALYIPPYTWHAVANTGESDLIMVFFFPYPDYPPTERR